MLQRAQGLPVRGGLLCLAKSRAEHRAGLQLLGHKSRRISCLTSMAAPTFPDLHQALPPVEFFIRQLGWAGASSRPHPRASCREHQGLGTSMERELLVKRPESWAFPFTIRVLIIVCHFCYVWTERDLKLSQLIFASFTTSINTSLLPSLLLLFFFCGGWTVEFLSGKHCLMMSLFIFFCASSASRKAKREKNNVVMVSSMETWKRNWVSMGMWRSSASAWGWSGHQEKGVASSFPREGKKRKRKN